MIFPHALRVGGQSGQHGGAGGQKVLPVLPGHQVHRCCWSGALPRTPSEGGRLPGRSPTPRPSATGPGSSRHVSFSLRPQLGGWAVSGQWNRTDFNSTLRQLMRDYATFPFFSLQVGPDPEEVTSGIPKKYIQASPVREDSPNASCVGFY